MKMPGRRSWFAVIVVCGLIASTCQASALDEQKADGLLQKLKQGDKGALSVLNEGAEHGDAIAQDRLGLAYLVGLGVEKKPDEARNWLLKAAAQNYAYAEFRLGIMYEEGLGVAADISEAVKWYFKAAEQGNVLACNNLGQIYQKGKGVPADAALAEKWYRIAADKDLTVAQLSLGFLYVYPPEGRPNKYEDAFRLFSRAAEKGNARAMHNLGVLYENGWGVPKSDAIALSWYRKAIDAGEWLSLGTMAFAYKDGKLGLPKDIEKSNEWYKKFIDAQLGRTGKSH